VTGPGLILRNVELDGAITDVTVRGSVVESIGSHRTKSPADEELDGGHGALIPGLHDHHLHLLATAAAAESVVLGPPQVTDRSQFAEVLTRAAGALPPGSWVRGVGYHESVAGELDRWILDSIVPDRPARIQHSSGAAWFLNSPALSAIGEASADGRMYRRDGSMRTDGAAMAPRTLRPTSRLLSAYGVTGVTDATPSEDLSSVELLGRAVSDGSLVQDVTVTGAPSLAGAPPVEGIHWGPVKFVIADHELPTLARICEAYRIAHENDRSIAVHCVTPVALALALAAWSEAGVRPGDRVEHGAVVSPEAAERMAELGLVVVTQPGFIASRGDRYLVEVERADIPHLYPCGSLMARGIRVGGSTDAPYGELDPWRAMAAAITRRTASGHVISSGERVTPERALGLFLTPPEEPGGRPRSISPGMRANVCLLDRPLREVLDEPSSDHVSATIIGGCIAYLRRP
jgi:predicted amidohydrolase YtcJ